MVFAGAVLAVLAAGCGASRPPAPPTARALLAKIPACHGFVAQTPSVLAVSDGSCPITGSALGSIEVVTFATMGSEQRWIARQGGYYGCCVEGRLWAADSDAGTGQFPAIIRALGGRAVTG